MANITITFETPSVEGADALSPIKILMYGMPGSGITAGAKRSLLALLEKVAYIDEDGQEYLDALEAELFPPASLASISAVYSGGSVMAGTSLDSLKSDLTVTATYDDGSSEEVTTYTLSGTISDNPSAITVSYGGKVTTFNVPVVTLSSITAVYTQSGSVYSTDTLDSLLSDLVVTANYSNGTTATVTDYTLSGTLAEGTSTVTVSYGGKSDTFNVTVLAYYYPMTLTADSPGVGFGSVSIDQPTKNPPYVTNTTKTRTHAIGDNGIGYPVNYGKTYRISATAAYAIGIQYFNVDGQTQLQNTTAVTAANRVDSGWITATNNVITFTPGLVNNKEPVCMWLNAKKDSSGSGSWSTLADVLPFVIEEI